MTGMATLAPLTEALNTQRLLQDVLIERGFGHVKVIIQHLEAEVSPNVIKPSEFEFHDVIKPYMIQHLQFLRENNAPFPLDIIPMIDVFNNNFDPSFAFPDNASSLVIHDVNGAVYTNAIEWRYDSFMWALEKLNFSDVPIDISVLGWPTDG